MHPSVFAGTAGSGRLVSRRGVRGGALSLLALWLAAGAALTAQTPESHVDRTKAPPALPAKPLTFPHARSRTLKNGVRVVVLEDHHMPVVSVVTVLDVSPALEPAGKTGLLDMVRAMLREGTTDHSADQLADAFADLGNTVSPFGFYTITANVDRSLALMAEQLLHPLFPDSALARLKANTVTDLREREQNPRYLSDRTLREVVNGKSHPYARTETEAETMSITRDDVARFYGTYFRPPNVTFVVAGDITPEQAVRKLDRLFGAWQAGASGQVTIPPPAGVAATTVYLYDRPHSPQSVVAIGGVGPRRDAPEFYAIQLMNTILGGAFTSRLNLNLRERHHYTYGANSGFQFRRVPELGMFRAGAAVATPKTDSALIEAMQELRDIRGTRPVTPQEFAFAETLSTGGLSLEFETIRQRAAAVAQLVRDRLPLDYYNTVVARFEAVTLSQVEGAAVKYIDPSRLAIVVVGDRGAIEPELRAAGIAPVVIVGSQRGH